MHKNIYDKITKDFFEIDIENKRKVFAVAPAKDLQELSDEFDDAGQVEKIQALLGRLCWEYCDD